MKTKLFLFCICLAFASFGFAQLKVVTPGDVGIGTSTPQAKLHVVGNAVFSTNSTIGTSARAPYIRGSNTYSTASAPSFTWYNNDNTGLFNPSHNIIGFSVGGVEKMRINYSGNVCIGSTTSQSTHILYVSGLSRFKPNSTDNGIVIDNSGYTGKSTLKPYTNWNAMLGSTECYWGVIAGDHIFYNILEDMSDENLKENIREIEDPLSKILRLNGVKYDLKPEIYTEAEGEWHDKLVEDGKDQFGFLAQELMLVIPELVSLNDNGYYGVNYIDLIPIIVEAIKDQQAQIDEMQHQTVGLSGIDLPSNGEAKSNSSRLNPHSAAKKSQNISIGFYVDKIQTEASLLLFDMQGKLIKTYPIAIAGEGQIAITANSYAAGMYLYSLVVDGNEIATRKIILTE